MTQKQIKYSFTDEQAGLPKQKAIIAGLNNTELQATRTDTWIASTDPVFGNANRPLLKIIEAECRTRGI